MKDEPEDTAWAKGERAIEEDRVISHEAVTRWLKSWGSPSELPPPKAGD
jgi:predicted transcriptional regulator